MSKLCITMSLKVNDISEIVNSCCTITFHWEVFTVVINQPLIRLMDAVER